MKVPLEFISFDSFSWSSHFIGNFFLWGCDSFTFNLKIMLRQFIQCIIKAPSFNNVKFSFNIVNISFNIVNISFDIVNLSFNIVNIIIIFFIVIFILIFFCGFIWFCKVKWFFFTCKPLQQTRMKFLISCLFCRICSL